MTTPLQTTSIAPDTARPSDTAHVINILILSLFLCEVILKLIVRKLEFFKHRFEVFDLSVVVFTLLLAIVLFAAPVHPVTRDAFGFIILLRLWRTTQIIFGASLTEKKAMDQLIFDFRRIRMCAEERANILQQKLEQKQFEIQKLKERLKLLQPRAPEVVLERDKADIVTHSNNSVDTPANNSPHSVPSTITTHLYKRHPNYEINNRTPNGSLHSLTDTERSMNGSVPSFEHSNTTSQNVSRRASVDSEIRDVNTLELVITSDDKRLINGDSKLDNFAFLNPSFTGDGDEMGNDSTTPRSTEDDVGTPKECSTIMVDDARGFNASLSPEELDMVRRLATLPNMKGEGVPITSL